MNELMAAGIRVRHTVAGAACATPTRLQVVLVVLGNQR